MGDRGVVQGVEAVLPLAGVSKFESQYSKEIRSNVFESTFAITGV